MEGDTLQYKILMKEQLRFSLFFFYNRSDSSDRLHPGQRETEGVGKCFPGPVINLLQEDECLQTEI